MPTYILEHLSGANVTAGKRARWSVLKSDGFDVNFSYELQKKPNVQSVPIHLLHLQRKQ
jgi:hypothetical protein